MKKNESSALSAQSLQFANSVVTAHNTLGAILSTMFNESKNNAFVRECLITIYGSAKKFESLTKMRANITPTWALIDKETGAPCAKVETAKGRYMYVICNNADTWRFAIAMQYERAINKTPQKSVSVDIEYTRKGEEYTKEMQEAEETKAKEAKEKREAAKEAKAKEADETALKVEALDALNAKEYEKALSALNKIKGTKVLADYCRAQIALTKAETKEARKKAEERAKGRAKAISEAQERAKRHAEERKRYEAEERAILQNA